MKKVKEILSLCYIFTAIVSPQIIFAQPTFYTPSNSDYIYATRANQPFWMNNAELRVSTTNFTAVTWDEGGGSVYVEAGKNGTTLGGIIAISAPNANFSGVMHPDVALGTDGVNLYCAVIYTAIGQAGAVNQIYMDMYTIASATCNLTGQCVGILISAYPNNPSTNGTGDAHIDLINKYTNPGLSKNDFVIAWEEMDCSQNTTFGVSACAGQFSTFCNNNPPPLVYPTSCINGAGIDGAQVDVAGIERNLPPVHNFALFTYVDPSNSNTLYYNEWDATNALGR